MNAPNRNILWAKVFVDELARGGLRAVCIAPGSRSTPLVIAFAEHPDIKVYSHIDERSTSFFALGLALATNAPVAMLCSSGTATANFYPAIIEAHYSGVPLLVLTADRPPEVRGSGANQTIDQVKMYGDHVLWSVDVALPEAEPPGLAVRNLRTLAARALATANGIPKGPVHLNFPFRKPLEPTLVERDLHDLPDEHPTNVPYMAMERGLIEPPANVPFTVMERGLIEPLREQIKALGQAISLAKRGLIVCGPRCPSGLFPDVVSRLAQKNRFVLIADPLSGVRYSSHPSRVISGYDTFLKVEIEPPDMILSFGGAVTSQVLDDYLNKATAYRVVISADGVWADPSHRVDTVLWADPTRVCIQLNDHLQGHIPFINDVWWANWKAVEHTTHNIIASETGDYFDGLVLRDVIDVLPDGSRLFVANSLPVRHLDQFGLATPKDIQIFCNRGASGIDGTISSALGVAAADPDTPLVLVSGDLAFYHDLNGLMAIKRCGIKAVLVVINNDGGGIFGQLPIAQFDPPFTELFVTPHGLTFEHAAQMYGIDYTTARDSQSFRAALTQALSSSSSTIIEVPTERQHDAQRRAQLAAQVVEALSPVAKNQL